MLETKNRAATSQSKSLARNPTISCSNGIHSGAFFPIRWIRGGARLTSSKNEMRNIKGLNMEQELLNSGQAAKEDAMAQSTAHFLKEPAARTPFQESTVQKVSGSMACGRCGGLIVHDFFLDLLDDTGHFEFQGTRCVQCGDLTDPVILQNRARQSRAVEAQRLREEHNSGRQQGAHNHQNPA